ncbi:MAG: RagB/SusD family nutrient uptake outer membrane protein [Chitinophagaceae bacterium]
MNYSELNNWANAQTLNWAELYYPRFVYNGSQMFIPSRSLLALYNRADDLRYKWLMIPFGGRRSNILDSVHRYTVFDDGRYMISGPTVAEVLLNRAEASARTGDISTAMTMVNRLRTARYRAGTNSALTANNNDEAIALVLAERRREMPAVHRWVDIRRFSVNDYPADDVTITRNFFQVNNGSVDITVPRVYTIAPGSPRYAVPINGTELINSGGEIKQNSY